MAQNLRSIAGIGDCRSCRGLCRAGAAGGRSPAAFRGRRTGARSDPGAFCAPLVEGDQSSAACGGGHRFRRQRARCGFSRRFGRAAGCAACMAGRKTRRHRRAGRSRRRPGDLWGAVDRHRRRRTRRSSDRRTCRACSLEQSRRAVRTQADRRRVCGRRGADGDHRRGFRPRRQGRPLPEHVCRAGEIPFAGVQ